MSIVLHIIAAVLWLGALWIAAGTGMLVEKDDPHGALVGLVITLALAVIAFALQVIA